MERQRGFTLLELTIAIAILATIALTGVGTTMASRSLAVTNAAMRFDGLLDTARATAHAFRDGATLVFAPDAYGDGATVRLFRGRPAAGALVAVNAPALESRAAISETELLQTPGFALALYPDGRVTGVPHYALGSAPGAESGCPPSGAFHFVFAYGGGRAERSVPCRLPVAASGPVAVDTAPPASGAQPTIVPDAGCAEPSCALFPVPPIPNATCPPGDVYLTVALCINAFAVYQLSVVPVDSAIAVGDVAAWTANESMGYGLSGGDTSVAMVNPRGGNCGGYNFAAGQWVGSGYTFRATGMGAGTCAFDVVDKWGHLQTVTATVRQPFGALQIGPSASGPWGSTLALGFATAAAPAQSVFVQEAYYTGAFAIDGSGCAGFAQVASQPGPGPGPVSFSIRPQAGRTSCGITVADTRGTTATVTVSVQVPTCRNGLTPNPDGSCVDQGLSCKPPRAFDAALLDSYGYYSIPCTSSVLSVQCALYDVNGNYAGKSAGRSGTATFVTYDASGASNSELWTALYTADPADCANNSVAWSSPYPTAQDPAAYYSDPNLP